MVSHLLRCHSHCPQVCSGGPQLGCRELWDVRWGQAVTTQSCGSAYFALLNVLSQHPDCQPQHQPQRQLQPALCLLGLRALLACLLPPVLSILPPALSSWLQSDWETLVLRMTSFNSRVTAYYDRSRFTSQALALPRPSPCCYSHGSALHSPPRLPVNCTFSLQQPWLPACILTFLFLLT